MGLRTKGGLYITSFLQNLNLNFGKMGQFSSISKHRHIAYQIKGNEE